jgi:hypothetical protein
MKLTIFTMVATSLVICHMNVKAHAGEVPGLGASLFDSGRLLSGVLISGIKEKDVPKACLAWGQQSVSMNGVLNELSDSLEKRIERAQAANQEGRPLIFLHQINRALMSNLRSEIDQVCSSKSEYTETELGFEVNNVGGLKKGIVLYLRGLYTLVRKLGTDKNKQYVNDEISKWLKKGTISADEAKELGTDIQSIASVDPFNG